MKDEIQKVYRRVPQWFRKTHQYNSQILIAFLKVSNCNQHPIFPSLIERNCSLGTKQFWINFNDMKISHRNGHGKVFEENLDGTIKLWELVANFIIDEYKNVKDRLS